MNSIAVVGIGNNLLQDDGAGIHVLEHFEKHHSYPDVDCLDAGTVGLALMDRLTNLDGLIAVDAMRLGKTPGTVTVLEGEAMDAHLRNHHGSVHELGLSDILNALRLWGTEPTDEVAVAIPRATARVRDLIRTWREHCSLEASA